MKKIRSVKVKLDIDSVWELICLFQIKNVDGYVKYCKGDQSITDYTHKIADRLWAQGESTEKHA